MLQWDRGTQDGEGAVSRAQAFVHISAGEVTLGTDLDGSCGFVRDNEGPRQVGGLC